MTIPYNKNVTKQLNSYSYVIAITLQGLLQRTKWALKLNQNGQTRKLQMYESQLSKNKNNPFRKC